MTSPVNTTETIEAVFSFDTTGSMAPCLRYLRKTTKQSVERLFKEVPNLRMGIIAHGDYCDAGDPYSYVIKVLDLTSNMNEILDFIETCGDTGGGDAPECYELALHEATNLNWSPKAKKFLAVIGDELPHGPTYSMNTKKIDWRNELKSLLEKNVNVCGIQALKKSHATPFYKEMADRSGGFHFNLDQFTQITDTILAMTYKQVSPERLSTFEKEVKDAGRMNRSLDDTFSTLMNRSKSTSFGTIDLEAVPSGMFQTFQVEEEQAIKDFTESNGLRFKQGDGFYEFTKSETIQAKKQIVLMDKFTGDLFTGTKARELAGIPEGKVEKLKPAALHKYRVFVQSTSNNRKLRKGQGFLYRVDTSM
jgi:hypothetical protein